MRKRAIVGVMALLGALPLLWMQQGCVGDFAPLSVMVLTATPTQTLVPTPSYPSCSNVSSPPYMIDNVEDGNNGVLLNQCRNGYWFSYNDGTGGGIQTISYNTTAGVDLAGTGTSTYCVRVLSNAGFTNWGTGFGLSLTNPQGNYNALGFTGIRFHGRNVTGSVSLKVIVTDNDVVNAVPAYSVGGHRVFVTVTPAWALHQITFAALAASPNDYGPTPTVFDVTRIQQIQMAIAAATACDLQIDNLSFY